MSDTGGAADGRRDRALLPWLRAAALAGLTLLALSGMAAFPPVIVVLAALSVGTLALLVPGLGVLALLVIVGIPMLAGDLVAGISYLALGIALLTYRRDGGTRFFVVALALAATQLHAEWAIPAIAGLLLGSSEGAVLALVACLAIEGAGLVFGIPRLGVTLTASGGSHTALIAPAYLSRIADPLSFGWLPAAVSHFDVSGALRTLAAVRSVQVFALQPMAWAAAAAVTGALRPGRGGARREVLASYAVAAGVAVAAVLTSVVDLTAGSPLSVGDILVGSAAAVLAGVIVVAVADTWFTPELATVPAPGVDVDSLLTELARAERPEIGQAVVRTVIITDVESFARLTQDLGSADAARLVQKHREIVLPLFARHGGHGAAAGGDGLVAAFEQPAEAIAAAVDMQRALDTFNVGQPSTRKVRVRCGIASGDVVLDRDGRPFLGDALNVAARIMGIAGAGQILASRQVIAAAGALAFGTEDYGSYALRNIADRVEIVAVLWREGHGARSLEGPANRPAP